jgi:hypothetical protein
VLEAEQRLCNHLDRIPTAYDPQTQSKVIKSKDDLIFAASEYIKDGLIAIIEVAGTDNPWFRRMQDIVDDIWMHAEIDTPYGPIPTKNLEANGEQIQALVRLFTATGERKYLDWAESTMDGIADSAEGAIYLVNHLHVPGAIEWIDREVTTQITQASEPVETGRLWNTYKLESNGVRTALQHAMMHTRGTIARPWRKDLTLGASHADGELTVVLNAGTTMGRNPGHRPSAAPHGVEVFPGLAAHEQHARMVHGGPRCRIRCERSNKWRNHHS